jgi:hypothetical protein
MRTHDSPDVHFPVHMHCKGTILTSDRKKVVLMQTKVQSNPDPDQDPGEPI